MNFISIIIPAKNEEENIAFTVQEINKAFISANINHEIIVVDDGSRDDTSQIVFELSKKNNSVILIKNNPPYGVGNAIKKGLENYKGNIVIIAMADASDKPSDMIKYVQEIDKGYECCFGNRWVKGTSVKGYPRFKYFLNRIINGFISILFQLKYSDVTNAFKCYSRQTIEGIKPIVSRHFNITVELPLKAIVRGYSYSIIPTNWRERQKGKTNLKLKEMGSRYLFTVIYVLLEKWLCGSDYKRQ